MTISEKIIHNNSSEVHLYKEGIFWIAYDQSAYFVSQVKTLKLTRKFVKKLGKEIISVGFPDSVLEKIIPHFTLKRRTDTQVDLEAGILLDPLIYIEWEQGILMEQTLRAQAPMIPATSAISAAPAAPAVASVESAVISRIRKFDIINATPIQCLIFLNEIHGTLRESSDL